mmetsp:Transcript_20544/g.35032  ORF Transcript_20544/g.35032 Transcript_20544/m.35032 type:complete len:101 (+) Transcript_20544:367-669(+)
MTDAQVESLHSAIRCPVLVILGENGYPMDPTRVERIHTHYYHSSSSTSSSTSHSNDNNNNKTKEGDEEQLRVVTLPGSHHLHADPATADRVVECITKFVL